MRKDLHLILKLLVFIRDNADGKQLLPVPYFCNFEPEIVEHHLRLCCEDGFIVMKTLETIDTLNPTIMGISHVTATGHREIERLSNG